MQTEMHSLHRLPPDYFLQRFTAPPLVFQPGQFIMVKPSGSLDPFLPRAYSILRVQRPSTRTTGRGDGGHVVEIFYKVIGKGSTALSRLKPGDRVDLLGPLGKGYRVPSDLTSALLVAGGIGVPPVVALAERLASRGFRVEGAESRAESRGKGKAGRRPVRSGRRTSASSPRQARGLSASKAVEPSPVAGPPKMIAFVGGKSAEDILCLTDLRKAGAAPRVATEDGSRGHRGLVTDLLEEHLRSAKTGERPTIYACGPHTMLHAVARIAERFEIPCQVSLEADMACGFGACMGCVIPVKSLETSASSPRQARGLSASKAVEPSRVESLKQTMNHFRYKLCCKDGPAFDAREIAW